MSARFYAQLNGIAALRRV